MRMPILRIVIPRLRRLCLRFITAPDVSKLPPARNKRSRTYLVSRGILAQLGEHLPYKQRVIGSSPIGPTFVPVWSKYKWVDSRVAKGDRL